MRNRISAGLWMSSATVAAAMLLSACEATPTTPNSPSAPAGGAAIARKPAPPADPGLVEVSAQDAAARMSAAMAHSQTPDAIVGPPSAPPSNQVMWETPARPRTASSWSNSTPGTPPSPAPQSSNVVHTIPLDPPPVSRTTVDTTTSAASPAGNASTAKPKDTTAATPSKPSDSTTVVAAAPPPAAVVDTGPEPIKVRTLELCKKVRGFGSYDAFDSRAFLAGRDNPVIVYCELDHFKSVHAASGMYQVKLTQEVSLYTDQDGMLAWRQPAAQIVDESRNQRRDFFIVQLVKLPARLTVGKYWLKVHIHDDQGNSIDEQSIPVQIVSDQAIASK